MSAVSLMFIQSAALIVFKLRDKRTLNRPLLFLILLTAISNSVLADSDVASVKILENTEHSSTNELNERDEGVRRLLVNAKGTYVAGSSRQKTEGRIILLPENECGEDDDVWLTSSSRFHGNWVGFLNYEFRDESNDTFRGEGCNSVLDRVRKAMVVGASAIIILALNPRVIKEIDLGQYFAKPVILIQTANNVSSILNALLHKLGMTIKISPENMSHVHLQTYTVWSTCWRAKPGSGVVCGFRNSLGNADPMLFWNYFFSAIATMILFLILKTDYQNEPDEPREMQECVRRLAVRALQMMRVQKYRRNLDDRDTCAICLDLYKPKQRLRILPCGHEFHASCVDPWLLSQQTCPLCKCNAIDEQLLGAPL